MNTIIAIVYILFITIIFAYFLNNIDNIKVLKIYMKQNKLLKIEKSILIAEIEKLNEDIEDLKCEKEILTERIKTEDEYRDVTI